MSKNFLLKRILWLFPIIFGVVTLVFFLIHLIPGDPVDLMLGEHARSIDRQDLRHELGLDQPLTIQYIDFIKKLSRGNLGISIHSKQPVLSLILHKYPATFQLMLAAVIMAIFIALPLGIFSALKPHSLVDYASLILSLLGISMPHFWLGPLLIIVFSLKLGWLPVSGRGGLANLILPSFTLGTAMAAILTRMIRSSLIDVLGEDYITTARSKGLPFRKVVLKHAVKNAIIPPLTILGLQIGSLLTGSIITEMIFAWPGLGRLTIQAIYSRDFPLIQGCVLIIAITYVLVNLLTDLTYTLIDPRIQFDFKNPAN